MRRLLATTLLLPLLALAGCDGFFFKDTTSSSGTGTAATNYAFVTNIGANTVTGLGISTTGALAALKGSPITLTVPPLSVVVSHDNKFLWVGTASQIFGYSIATDGTLASINGGNALVNAFCQDMQVTPDGKWLMVLDGTGNSVDLFAIATNGTLAANNGIGFNVNGTVVPHVLRINPAGTVVVAAMGTAGELVFSFNTSTGAFSQLAQIQPPSLSSDNGIAIDATGAYLYIARSGANAGLIVNTINSNGTLTPTTSAPYATGALPYSVAIDTTGKYVYVANRTDGTLTGYGIGTGAALTALPGSPYSSGIGTVSLGAESTGKFILAASYGGGPDLALYGFDSSNPGRLYSVSSTATGTNASVLALSH